MTDQEPQEELPGKYTNEEFAQDFLLDNPEPDYIEDIKSQKFITQRVWLKELSKLVARKARYKQYEAEDILKALFEVINEQIELGRDIQFGDLFSIGMYKPKPRRLFDFETQGFKMSSARPRLRLTPNWKYRQYLERGLHSPVCHFPSESMREGTWVNREKFTKTLKAAIDQYEQEVQRRVEWEAKNGRYMKTPENRGKRNYLLLYQQAQRDAPENDPVEDFGVLEPEFMKKGKKDENG